MSLRLLLHRYKQRLDPRTQTTYYKHRAVAEWKLGRPLLSGEVVHHVNGDTHDNHPDNIWVFSSQRAHMIYHNYRWQQQRGVVHLFSVEEVLRARGGAGWRENLVRDLAGIQHRKLWMWGVFFASP